MVREPFNLDRYFEEQGAELRGTEVPPTPFFNEVPEDIIASGHSFQQSLESVTGRGDHVDYGNSPSRYRMASRLLDFRSEEEPAPEDLLPASGGTSTGIWAAEITDVGGTPTAPTYSAVAYTDPTVLVTLVTPWDRPAGDVIPREAGDSCTIRRTSSATSFVLLADEVQDSEEACPL